MFYESLCITWFIFFQPIYYNNIQKNIFHMFISMVPNNVISSWGGWGGGNSLNNNNLQRKGGMR